MFAAGTLVTMVVGGSTQQSDANTEIISIDDGTLKCAFPEYASFETSPDIVNVFDTSFNLYICGPNECYALEKNARMEKWSKRNFTLLAKRSQAASAPLFSIRAWLVSGGEVLDSEREVTVLKSSEVFANETFSPGPPLMQAVSGHCMVRLNSTSIGSFGGRDQSLSFLSSAHMLSKRMLWSELPAMNEERYGHTCGLIRGDTIVVVGGLHISSVEMWPIFGATW